jgi:hypothetical protein
MENVTRYDKTQAGSLCYIGFPDYRAVVSQNHPGSYRREPAVARDGLRSTTGVWMFPIRGPKWPK